jgi:hypothetical protein
VGVTGRCATTFTWGISWLHSTAWQCTWRRCRPNLLGVVYWQDEKTFIDPRFRRYASADVRLHHQGGITARSLRNFSSTTCHGCRSQMLLAAVFGTAIPNRLLQQIWPGEGLLAPLFNDAVAAYIELGKLLKQGTPICVCKCAPARCAEQVLYEPSTKRFTLVCPIPPFYSVRSVPIAPWFHLATWRHVPVSCHCSNCPGHLRVPNSALLFWVRFSVTRHQHH